MRNQLLAMRPLYSNPLPKVGVRLRNSMSGPPLLPPLPRAPIPPAIPSPLLPPPPPPHWLEDFGDGDLGSGEVAGILVGVCILLGICYYERCAPCPRAVPVLVPIAFHPYRARCRPPISPHTLCAAQAPFHVLLPDEPHQTERRTKQREPD